MGMGMDTQTYYIASFFSCHYNPSTPFSPAISNEVFRARMGGNDGGN